MDSGFVFSTARKLVSYHLTILPEERLMSCLAGGWLAGERRKRGALSGSKGSAALRFHVRIGASCQGHS